MLSRDPSTCHSTMFLSDATMRTRAGLWVAASGWAPDAAPDGPNKTGFPAKIRRLTLEQTNTGNNFRLVLGTREQDAQGTSASYLTPDYLVNHCVSKVKSRRRRHQGAHERCA